MRQLGGEAGLFLPACLPAAAPVPVQCPLQRAAPAPSHFLNTPLALSEYTSCTDIVNTHLSLNWVRCSELLLPVGGVPGPATVGALCAGGCSLQRRPCGAPGCPPPLHPHCHAASPSCPPCRPPPPASWPHCPTTLHATPPAPPAPPQELHPQLQPRTGAPHPH